MLRLTHVANTQTVQASFDYLSGGVVVATQSLTGSATIFTNEIWTRAQVVASAPQQATSVLDTDYGTPTIDQFGNWTYTLANDRTNVQALAEGQTAIDTFTVQVTDEHGASASQSVNVTVTGDNDAPLIQFASPTQPPSASSPRSPTMRRARIPPCTAPPVCFVPRPGPDRHAHCDGDRARLGLSRHMTAAVTGDTTGGHGDTSPGTSRSATARGRPRAGPDAGPGLQHYR